MRKFFKAKAMQPRKLITYSILTKVRCLIVLNKRNIKCRAHKAELLMQVSKMLYSYANCLLCVNRDPEIKEIAQTRLEQVIPIRC